MGFCGVHFLYTLINLFGSYTYGWALTYPSPAVPEIQQIMDISLFESTFFNSVTSLGGMVGALSAQYLLNLVGKKISTFAIGAFGCIFAIALPFMTERHIWAGIVARAMIGIAIGAVTAVIPQNIKEIAPPKYINIYGSMSQFGYTFGGMLCLFFSDFMNWKVLSFTHGGIYAALALLIWVVPLKKKTDTHQQQKTESLFQRKYVGKIFIEILIMFFQQCSGVNGVVSNLNDLFSRAGLDMSLGIASGIAQSAQVIAAIVGSLLIHKLGRKVIWIASEIGCVVFLLLYALSIKFDNWPAPLAIVFVFLYLLFFGIGLGPIPWYIVPEIFPASVISQAVSFGTMFNWLFCFLVVFSFQYLVDALGNFGSMFIFLGICVLGTIFGFIYVTDEAVVKNDESSEKNDSSHSSNVLDESFI